MWRACLGLIPACAARSLRFRHSPLVGTRGGMKKNRELRNTVTPDGPPPLLSRDGEASFELSDVLKEYFEAAKRGMMDHATARQTLVFMMSCVTKSNFDSAIPHCNALFGDIESRYGATSEDWTVMIQVYGRAGRPKDAVTIYDRMVSENAAPSQQTFGALMRAHALVDDKETARAYFGEMLSRNLCGDHVDFESIYDGLRRM
eukprot:NODE_3701_length_931_cov_38.697279_g3402_i0.p1 GENE.NODE_3701_length_931_cov_38.697279_g3402_i0~~NODE_3701_length_931_cov_38.697279_g3402_i0.p1  ORF type:complete len:203 (+),score=34.00 NODE_3701_length_931_cov_38.697279_g3402_i0:119-727(+)